MPSRRQIREAVVQFLYCADLEGVADPAALRDPFWDFVTESDRRSLQLATFRTVHHLAQGREGRLAEFSSRLTTATTLLSAWPEAEPLKSELTRIADLEAQWSAALAELERLPKDDDNASVAESFKSALDRLFLIDRSLAKSRNQFLTATEDFPALRGQLEAVAASVRRLQRISDRLRMVEEPEKFPEQADLARLRDSKEKIHSLRQRSDDLVDALLKHKEAIGTALSSVVENYSPERIDPVDRAILRLATYEILFTSAPRKVAINEAIELAKRFGTSDSQRFVNGVLDRIAKPPGEETNSGGVL
ncbi:MAG: transcription antitermination factor NusB [Gloeobacteraceae cyanobacterium ES-bin-144]|nr:transcription antitermination factor NusB [Verrucomicrobiales bacterium]